MTIEGFDFVSNKQEQQAPTQQAQQYQQRQQPEIVRENIPKQIDEFDGQIPF